MKHDRQRRFACQLFFLAASFCAQSFAQANLDQAAQILEQQGKNVEAEDAWKKLAEARPADPLPLAHLGLLEARQEHYPQAIAFYRKAMALDPDLPGLRLNLGLAFFKDGQYTDCIHIFAPMLKDLPASSPERQRLDVLLGMSHYGLGEYAAATPFLKQASQQDPRNSPLLLTLAHSCLLSSQYPCVLDAYHRMVELNANSAEADMLVGEALDEMKDPVGALREFRAAVEANPKEPNVHFGLGYLLWTKGQYSEAAQQFQTEIENDPGNMQAALYLADSEIQMNRMDDARQALEKLALAEPSNEMVHRDLGIVYADKERNDEALREFKSAAAIKPGDVNVHWRLGRLYRTLGQNAQAKAEFEKARTLNKAQDDRLLKVMSKSRPSESNAREPAKTVP